MFYRYLRKILEKNGFFDFFVKKLDFGAFFSHSRPIPMPKMARNQPKNELFSKKKFSTVFSVKFYTKNIFSVLWSKKSIFGHFWAILAPR